MPGDGAGTGPQQPAGNRPPLALQLGHNLAGDLAGLFDGPGRKANRADFRMAAAAVALANGRQVVLDLIAGPRT